MKTNPSITIVFVTFVDFDHTDTMKYGVYLTHLSQVLVVIIAQGYFLSLFLITRLSLAS